MRQHNAPFCVQHVRTSHLEVVYVMRTCLGTYLGRHAQMGILEMVMLRDLPCIFHWVAIRDGPDACCGNSVRFKIRISSREIYLPDDARSLARKLSPDNCY